MLMVMVPDLQNELTYLLQLRFMDGLQNKISVRNMNHGLLKMLGTRFVVQLLFQRKNNRDTNQQHYLLEANIRNILHSVVTW